MKKYVLVALVAAGACLLTVGGLAWATGVVDPLAVIHPAKVEGTAYVKGEASVGALAMPFEAVMEFVEGEEEPQLRWFSVGEQGVTMVIPRVLKPQVEEVVGNLGRFIGDAASLSVGPVRLGLYVDAFRIDMVVSLNVPLENPYGFYVGEFAPDYPETVPLAVPPAVP